MLPFWGSPRRAMGMPALPPGLLRLLRRRPSLVLPPALTILPGAEQRRRLLVLLLACGLMVLLRPYWPLNLLPGWSVGLLPLWTVLELLRLAWWPRRWR